eukprot:363423-Chlamydomonas_euryale.AAC.1
MLRAAAELGGHDSGQVESRDIPEDYNRLRGGPLLTCCSASHAHAPGACACSCCVPPPYFQHGLQGVHMEKA